MKHVVIALIVFYQQLSWVLRSILGQASFCRYPVSCSSYATDVIKKHGVAVGGYKALLRLLSCHPFGSGNARLHV